MSLTSTLPLDVPVRLMDAKGLISYNFASNCHRDFKLGLYFNLWKGTSNMTLTFTFDLDLEKFSQGQRFGNIN